MDNKLRMVILDILLVAAGFGTMHMCGEYPSFGYLN
jgi:hypothetical protein